MGDQTEHPAPAGADLPAADVVDVGLDPGVLREREETYRALRAASDPSAVHDLIRDKGLSVLDKDVPYLVVAARNQQRMEQRSEQRRSRRERAYTTDPTASAGSVPGPAPGLWSGLADPADVALANEAARELLVVLASLDDREMWLLWWDAAGYRTVEMLQLWKAAGFVPRQPTAENLRKRLSRARRRARSALVERSVQRDP